MAVLSARLLRVQTGRSLAGALLVWASICLCACGISDRVIARDTSDAAATAPAARGRVAVRQGTLVSDMGTPLRGVTVAFDTNPTFPIDPAELHDLASSTGLNAVHVYVENWTNTTGVNAAATDALVDAAASAGLYVIVTIGGGPAGNGHPGNGWFDPAKVQSFWTFYAPRYKDRTHVLFEIQNNPELACDATWAAATITMERDAYTLIRSLAPATHVLLFSYAALPTPGTLSAGIDQVRDLVDWSNASVASHGTTDCLPLANLSQLVSVTRPRGVALHVTELPLGDSAPSVQAFEATALGWTSIEWLVTSVDLAAFRQPIDAANITWCPDFGTWPEVAATCRKP